MFGSTPEPPALVLLEEFYPDAAAFIAAVSQTGGRHCIQIAARLTSPVALVEIRDLLSDEQGQSAYVALEDLVAVSQDQDARKRIVESLWETGLFGNPDESNNDSILCQACGTLFAYILPAMLPPGARQPCPVCRGEIKIHRRG